MRTTIFAVIAAATLALLIPRPAAAEAVFELLHPAGYVSSSIAANDGTHQVGWGTSPGTGLHALYWEGTLASFIDLNPSGHQTQATALSGSVIVGIFDGTNAALWTSPSPSSFVNMHPYGNVWQSFLYATDGAVHAGRYNTFNVGISQAAFWLGTSSGYYPISPPATFRSGVLCTAAGIFGGFGQYTSGINHAFIWTSGTSAAAIDLNPAGAAQSTVRTTDGTTHAGEAYLGGPAQAYVWTGNSPATAVNITPPVAAGGMVNKLQQARFLGYYLDGANRRHACYWTSASAISAVDVSGYVPSPYVESEIMGFDGNLSLYGNVYDSTGTSYAAKWTLSATPANVTSVTVSPQTIAGGYPATGLVTLDIAAPEGGQSVQLSSNSPVVTVPSAVVVPTGATSITFAVQTSTVVNLTDAVVTATTAASQVSTTVTVVPLLKSVVLAPKSLTGGASTTGTVRLNTVAAGNTEVFLSSSASEATVPPSVIVPAGGDTVDFAVSTSPVPANLGVTLTAALQGATKKGLMTIKAPVTKTLILSPNPVVGGETSTGTVTLTGVAPAAGVTVALSTSNSRLSSVPSSVTIGAGASSITFSVTTYQTPVTDSSTIRATAGGVTKSLGIAILPLPGPTLANLTLSPNPVTGGDTVTATVTMSAPVSSDTVISLTCANARAHLPTGTVVIPAGQASVSFAITTDPVVRQATGAVKATFGVVTKSVKLTVSP